MHTAAKNRGFTLIEVLVVIAIIAVLAVVAILDLNPAELLKQSRDSNRLSDMATIKNALSMYLDDAEMPVLGSPATCYEDLQSTSDCPWSATASDTPLGNASSSIDGSGWIPVDFDELSAGAPFGSLPQDPINSTSGNYFYSYIVNGTDFKVTATMESKVYGEGGDRDAVSTDGGIDSSTYETGTNLNL
ncbi:MAG TPA: type II secretion system protein [Candidatus Paceibacterota bacterium]|nr:type II secretion system protein [Candidatus Paceibacterota bacterium]